MNTRDQLDYTESQFANLKLNQGQKYADEFEMIDTCLANTNHNDATCEQTVDRGSSHLDVINCSQANQHQESEIPPEVLQKYLGPAGLYEQSLNRTLKDLHVELNLELKGCYQTLLTKVRDFKIFQAMPSCQMIVNLLEQDLENLRYRSVGEFESMFDNLTSSGVNAIKDYNFLKKLQLDSAKTKIRSLCEESITESLQTMSERERLVFIIKNQLYINFLSEDVAQLDLNKILLPHLIKLSRDLLKYVATYC